MLMINNIKNYLYDKKYFINIFDDYIHVFNYLELLEFKDDIISFKMPNFRLIIHGSKFLITKMLKNELLIKGTFYSMEKKYE